MIKPVYTAIIDGRRLRFFHPSTEDRPFDLPWHSADDLMIIAGLDSDVRKEFRRALSDGLPDESRLIVANDGASTLIASDPVAQGFCDAMVRLSGAPDLREAYDKAARAARYVTRDDLLNPCRRRVAHNDVEAGRPA